MKRIVVDAAALTVRSIVQSMCLGLVISLINHLMFATTALRKNFAQKINISIAQSMQMRLLHEEEVKAGRECVFQMNRRQKWIS